MIEIKDCNCLGKYKNNKCICITCINNIFKINTSPVLFRHCSCSKGASKGAVAWQQNNITCCGLYEKDWVRSIKYKDHVYEELL